MANVHEKEGGFHPDPDSLEIRCTRLGSNRRYCTCMDHFSSSSFPDVCTVVGAEPKERGGAMSDDGHRQPEGGAPDLQTRAIPGKEKRLASR